MRHSQIALLAYTQTIQLILDADDKRSRALVWNLGMWHALLANQKGDWWGGNASHSRPQRSLRLGDIYPHNDPMDFGQNVMVCNPRKRGTLHNSRLG